jgi:hypothetical protein
VHLRLFMMILLVMASASHGDAMSDVSMERKRIMVSLCISVVDEYTSYAAGFSKPKDPVRLEREFERCAEIIDEYEMLSR